MMRYKATISNTFGLMAALFCAAAVPTSARCFLADPPNPFQSLEDAQKSVNKSDAMPIDLQSSNSDDTVLRLTSLLALTADTQETIKGVLAAQNKQVEAAKHDENLSEEARSVRIEAVYRVVQYQVYQSLTADQLLKLRVNQARSQPTEDRVRISKFFTYDARFAALPVADAANEWGDILKLTTEQRLALVPVLEEESKQLTALAGNSALVQDENRIRVQTAMITAERKINEMLTPDQKKAFDAAIIFGTAPTTVNPRAAAQQNSSQDAAWTKPGAG